MDQYSHWVERLAIQETLTRYAHALDSRQPELLQQVFTADADIDYSACGGAHGSVGEWHEWLVGAMSHFESWQHLLSNFVIELDGDTAQSLTRCYNPLQGRNEDGTRYVNHVGCHYRDQLVRTADGWRICKRQLGIDWMDPPV